MAPSAFPVLGGGRDIFPLSYKPFEPSVSRRLSRGVSQRIGRRSREISMYNECIYALNTCSNATESIEHRPCTARASVENSIFESVTRCRPPDACESPEAASQALLGTVASEYVEGPTSPTVFQLDALSWPTVAGGCDLVQALPSAERLDLEHFKDRLFLNKEELEDARKGEVGDVDNVKVFWAHELLNNRQKYLELVKEMYARGMIKFSRSCRTRVRVFSVNKKLGKQRLIIDCRRLNAKLRRPPKTSLASTATVSEIQVDSDACIEYSAHDVCDCFYQFKVPEELSEHLGLRDVYAYEVGISVLDGVPVTPKTKLNPLLVVLPMGFSYALHWAQAAHTEILVRSGVVDQGSMCFDFAPPPSLVGGAPLLFMLIMACS